MSSANDESPGNYDAEPQTYRLHYDWESDNQISTMIIEAVATITDTEPEDIGPLFEVVDTEALEQIFAPTPTRTRSYATSKLSFSIHDCAVTVSSDGLVEIHLPDS